VSSLASARTFLSGYTTLVDAPRLRYPNSAVKKAAALIVKVPPLLLFKDFLSVTTFFKIWKKCVCKFHFMGDELYNLWMNRARKLFILVHEFSVYGRTHTVAVVSRIK
jgi:hypothetical protein